MATLTNRAPKDTYKDLLQISNSNSGIDATLRTIEDGEGTSGPIQLSTTAFNILSGITWTSASDFAFSQADPELLGGDTNGVLLIGNGASNVLGSAIKLYGDTHATKAGDFEILNDNVVVASYDLSDLQFQFGVDVRFTQDNPEILGADTDGIMHISAGASNILGGSIRLFGDTHATQADDIDFYGSATLQLRYDDSASLWDFQANAITTTGAITFASIGGNWTNAGRTVADLGIVTTVDINGGTIDGVVIGGASAAAGTFTTITTSGNIEVNGTALTVDSSTNAYLESDRGATTNEAFVSYATAGSFKWVAGMDDNSTDDYVIRNLATATNSIRIDVSTDAVAIAGALSKGSGSFNIAHPLPELSETHRLVHSFVESNDAINIYRGKVTLVDGQAVINLDTLARMTEGTFVILNREISVFTSNESGWDAVRGSVSGNILTIECQEGNCTDLVSFMVIGERHDQHMMETHWTDENGRVIVEPEAE